MRELQAEPAAEAGRVPEEVLIRLFKPGPGAPGAGVEASDEVGTGDGESRIVCAACGADITTRGDRTEMSGRHEHYFVNPHGFDFRVACYRAAPGCVAIGAPSAEFTWFPGYRWQLALCGSCHAHLGWHFTGDGPPFYGLVADRLREAEDE